MEIDEYECPKCHGQILYDKNADVYYCGRCLTEYATADLRDEMVDNG